MSLIVGDVNTEALADELKAFFASEMPASLDGVTGDLDDWIDGNPEDVEAAVLRGAM